MRTGAPNDEFYTDADFQVGATFEVSCLSFHLFLWIGICELGIWVLGVGGWRLGVLFLGSEVATVLFFGSGGLGMFLS